MPDTPIKNLGAQLNDPVESVTIHNHFEGVGENPNSQSIIPKFVSGKFIKVPPYFTGRKEVLDDIKATLKIYRKASLCGIKGLGKTSVVNKFVEVNQADYQHIVFIRADRLGFISNLDEACKEMSLDFGEGDTEDSRIREFSNKIQELCTAAEADKFVLLIFDNVDEVQQITKFVSEFGKLHLLFTSNFERIHDIGHRVEIDNLSDDEAKLLLYRKTTNSFVENLDHVLAEDHESLLKIARLLGHHPFTLSTAGLYIRENRKTFAQYLNRLQNSEAKILQDERGVDAYHHANIYSAFLIPFEDIWEIKDDGEAGKAITEIACECLKIASLLSADEMPEEVFSQTTSLILPHYAEFIADEDNWDSIYRKLSRYGFFERNPPLSTVLDCPPTLSIHRLFRLFLKDKLRNEVDTVLEPIAEVLDNNFEQFIFTNKEKVERYLSHVGIYLEVLEANKLTDQNNLRIESTSTAGLCNRYASYFNEYGQYQKAEKYCLYFKDICESIESIDQNLLATSYNNLAYLYQSQGRSEEAEPYYLKSLTIREKVLGENHLFTAFSYNNLAILYESQGRYEEAEPYYLKSLDIREKVLGENHPSTATSYNNLAEFYRIQERYKEAEPYYLKALAIYEKVLGENHPDTATSYNNLAILYQSQGRYEEAEPYYLKSLDIREKVLGENHPSTATSYNNLAGLYSETDRFELAKKYQQKSLKIRLAISGENHPDVADSYWWFGTFCQKEANYAEALKNYKKAKEIYLRFLPKEHPDLQNLQRYINKCEHLVKEN